MSDNFLIYYNNALYQPNCAVNKRGYSFNEAMNIIQQKGWKDYELISIQDEIKKYNLQGTDIERKLMPQEVYEYSTWEKAYKDNNIKKISLPINVSSNEEYPEHLKDTFDKYCNAISKPAFIYEDGLVNEVKRTCSQILDVLSLLINGDNEEASIILKKVIEPFMDNPFLVNTLDKSYSFRGIAPFVELRNRRDDDIYQEMSETELTFFRARPKSKESSECISKKEHIVHLPYNLKEKASNGRFSRKGVPCLYFGTTSYVCCRECKWDSQKGDIYLAAFVPNEQGKTLKILNLTISTSLINGVYIRGIDKDDLEIKRKLQLSLIRMFPLVIATSYSITQEEREVKYEYLISQLLMELISKMGIDGVAYFSAKGKDEFQYPQGVNLAIPVLDNLKDRQYSRYCEMFNMTLPYLFNHQCGGDKESYINKIYKEYDEKGEESFLAKIDMKDKSVFYGETLYAKYDNWLISQKMRGFLEE